MILRVFCSRVLPSGRQLRSLSAELVPLSHSPLSTSTTPMIAAEEERLLKERCRTVARSCASIEELKQLFPDIYKIVAWRCWIRDVTAHMKRTRKPSGFWDLENCRKEALKYSSRTEFRNLNSGAYLSAIRHGWLDEICSHMRQRRKPNGYWNDKEICRSEALKFSNRSDFLKHSKSAYLRSLKNHWLEDICSHMSFLRSPSGHWKSKEVCAKEALKYKTRSEFEAGSPSAYGRAIKFDWLDDICQHMRPSHMLVPRGHWNVKSNCINEARKYSSPREFSKKSGSALQGCYRNGWLEEAYAHMPRAEGLNRPMFRRRKVSNPVVS